MQNFIALVFWGLIIYLTLNCVVLVHGGEGNEDKPTKNVAKIASQKDIIEFAQSIVLWAERLVKHYSYSYGTESARYAEGSITLLDDNSDDLNFVLEDYCQVECEWEHHKVDPYYYLPYELSHFYTVEEAARIEKFLGYLSKATNMKFIRRSKRNSTEHLAPYYLYILRGSSCWSHVGRRVKTGAQVMSLAGPQCTTPTTMFRKFAHLFGLGNEHQRRDRSRYIEVVKSNIEPQALNQFHRFPFPNTRLGRYLGNYEYDIASVTHYSWLTVGKKGHVTIIPLDPRWRSSLRYERTMMSMCDWNKILTFYPGEKKPPPCIPHSRGLQYIPTAKCNELYGILNCHTACHFVGGNLLNSKLCIYSSGNDEPELPSNIVVNPYFPNDADYSPSANEKFYRTFLVRVNSIIETHLC